MDQTTMDQTNVLLKKQNRLNRLIVLMLAVMVAALVITCVVVVQNANQISQTMVKVDQIVDDISVPTAELAEVDWNEITTELETITRELSTVDWEKLSTDIGETAVQAQESMKVAGEAVEAMDIETLNEAIADLKAIVEPLAKLFGKTTG